MPSRPAHSARSSVESAASAQAIGSTSAPSSARRSQKTPAAASPAPQLSASQLRERPTLTSSTTASSAAGAAAAAPSLTTVWARPPGSATASASSSRRPSLTAASTGTVGQHSGTTTPRTRHLNHRSSNASLTAPARSPNTATTTTAVVRRNSAAALSARTSTLSSRGLFHSSAASLIQQERRASRQDAAAEVPRTQVGSTDDESRQPGSARRLSSSLDGSESGSRRVRQRTRSNGEARARVVSSSRGSSMSSSSPLLQASSPSPLLSTVPPHRSDAAWGTLRGEEADDDGRRSPLLLRTYTPTTTTTATASGSGHHDLNSTISAGGGKRWSLQSRSDTTTPSRQSPCSPLNAEADQRNGPSQRAAASDKPWLTAPAGKGILKSRYSPRLRPGATVIASIPNLRRSSLSCTLPSPAPSGSNVSGASPSSPPQPPSLSATARSVRVSRHVHFDEANIQYLDASASHVIYSDSKIGVQLNNVEWGAVMLSPAAAHEYSAARRPDTGTAVSMGKAKPSAWGADSEWFNAEFGAQMEPHADHSDLTSPALTPNAAVAATATSKVRSGDGRQTERDAALVSSPVLAPVAPAAVVAHKKASASPSQTTSATFTPRAAGSDEVNALNVSVKGPSQLGASYTNLSNSLKESTSTGKRKKKQKGREEEPHPARPPTPPRAANDSRSRQPTQQADAKHNGDVKRTRGGSPVLSYERDSAERSALSRTSPPIAAPCSPNDGLVPAPPLSVGALRRRSSSSTALSSLPSPSPPSPMGGRHSGSRPRLSSPGVSLTNVDFSALEIEESFESATADLKATARPAAAASPPPSSSSATTSAVVPSTNAAGTPTSPADLTESPSASVLRLSESERRLLRAVMHVNQRSRAERTPDSPSHLTSTLRSTTSSTNGGGAGAQPPRDSTRSPGDPRTRDVLSSGIREFLEGDSKEGKNKRKKQHAGEAAAAPKRATPLPSPTSAADSAKKTVEAPPTVVRTRVVSTPLSSSTTTSARSPLNTTQRRSSASGPRNVRDARGSSDSSDSAVPSSDGSLATSSRSPDSPILLTSTRGGTFEDELNSARASLSRTTPTIETSGPDAIHVPATIATMRARQHLALTIPVEGAVVGKAPSQAAGVVVGGKGSGKLLPQQQQQPPPPRHPPPARRKLVSLFCDDPDDDDDAEPHLRAPVPTPQSVPKRRKSV